MTVTAGKISPRIPEDEWQLRQQLAACYRLFVRFGWTDVIFTHLSARVPGHDDQYLINPYGLLFTEITASSLLKVNFDGEVISGDYPYNDAGHAIHSHPEGAPRHQCRAAQPHPRRHGRLLHAGRPDPDVAASR